MKKIDFPQKRKKRTCGKYAIRYKKWTKVPVYFPLSFSLVKERKKRARAFSVLPFDIAGQFLLIQGIKEEGEV